MTKVEVVSVNVSEHKGTSKRPVNQIVIDDLGVAGDVHAGRWHRQVSLLAQESVERFASESMPRADGAFDRPIAPGQFGENITFRGVPAGEVAPLDRFVFGDVDLEITQIGKECHGSGCTIFQQVGKCVMPVEGLFARVLHGGTIRRSDRGEYRPRPFTCLVITLSDRAAAGEYSDRSGPRITELLDAFFANRRWHAAVAGRLLPDDPEQLRQQLVRAREDEIDVVFTTGGTGIGPGDVTPETIAPLCDKLLPGIMEHVRAKVRPGQSARTPQPFYRRCGGQDANLHPAGQCAGRRGVPGGNSQDA